MRTFKVECKDIQNWSGYVVLKHISYDQKWDYLESNGDVSKLEGAEQMKALRSMVRAVESNYIEVNLKNEVEGIECKSLDDMKDCPEMHNWIMTLALRIFNGNVGND